MDHIQSQVAPATEITSRPTSWPGGRLGRLRFFMYWSGLMMAAICAEFANLFYPTSFLKIDFLTILGSFITISLILARRRLFDLNMSGWWLLLFIVPFINIAFVLFLLLAPGRKATNRYGLAPRTSAASTAGIAAGYVLLSATTAVVVLFVVLIVIAFGGIARTSSG